MWKPKQLDQNKPLYIAVADAMDQDIADGVLKPGQRLPTQRELADMLEVNLSTVTRALKEAERRGLVSGVVGRGTFVSTDVKVSIPLARMEPSMPAPIEMGLVLPLPALEAAALEAARQALLSGDLNRYMRYADPAGLPEHREIGAQWVNRFGLNARAEDIIVTSGSQNGLACCLMGLFKYGDRIAVDALTFPGLKTLASMLGIRLVPIEMDSRGMIPESLETACRRESIRGLYLMPEFQNPTTLAMPEGRKDQIADVIKRHGLIFLEDDAFGYTGECLGTALTAKAPDHGVFFGGTSKVFGAGLRISFLAVPQRFWRSMEKAVLSTVWMAAPLNAAIVSGVIAGGQVEDLMLAKREEARARTALALEKFQGYTVHSRPTGFFIWLELPEAWTGREFEITAREAGVRVFCAEKFAVGGGKPPSAARISLTGPETREDLARGLDILHGILIGGYEDAVGII